MFDTVHMEISIRLFVAEVTLPRQVLEFLGVDAPSGRGNSGKLVRNGKMAVRGIPSAACRKITNLSNADNGILGTTVWRKYCQIT
jgi:hypothetical protein